MQFGKHMHPTIAKTSFQDKFIGCTSKKLMYMILQCTTLTNDQFYDFLLMQSGGY
ncbi:hypothetical protein DPMN_049555 [Dreissena polymorpha]|uniref:Uncharacterized protein n=1 Tax=Dreissena polymorpha TaxID=45954 RepID=A0A9D4HM82_DREPO|nr:hypothetical protein DPMN_049555 [Dreissena polymorpha]